MKRSSPDDFLMTVIISDNALHKNWLFIIILHRTTLSAPFPGSDILNGKNVCYHLNSL